MAYQTQIARQSAAHRLTTAFLCLAALIPALGLTGETRPNPGTRTAIQLLAAEPAKALRR